jgi:hypothetical protein
MSRTTKRIGLTQRGSDEGNPYTSRTSQQIENYHNTKKQFEYKKNDRGKIIKIELNKGGLSAKQKKIAAKAPPPDKIDAKDFAVLKAEKAKGRGMGLQDESIKPGKVMKANRGEFIKRREKLFKNFDKTIGVFPKVSSAAGGKGSGTGGRDTRTLTEKGQFIKRRMELASPKNITPLKALGKVATSRAGALGAILGAGAVGLNIAGKKLKEFADKKKDKKMGGGMAKKYSVGGGADMGAEIKKPNNPGTSGEPNPGTSGEPMRPISKEIFKKAKAYALAESMKDRDRLTKRDIQEATKALKPSQRKMAGGSVKKYSDGMSYKDMEPYGGKYAKKKNEMKATASENVKRLTTQPSAYDPEARYLVGERRGRDSTTRAIRKTTDQVNLREAANKLEKEAGPGFNVSINTKSDLIRKRLIRPKPMAGRMGGGMMNKPMGYKSGTMVKARGCKLGRTRPTKMY